MDITARCNNKCKYCYYPVDNSFLDITIERIISVFKRFPEFKIGVISGGEPTLHPNLFQLIEQLKGIGVYPYLLTNRLTLNNVSIKDGIVNSLLFNNK